VIVDGRKVEGQANPHLYHFYVDGDRSRVDFLDRIEKKGIFLTSARRSIRTKNVPEDGMFFDVHYDAVFNPAHAAGLKPLADRKQPLGEMLLRIEDLGATPETVGNQTLRGIQWYLDMKEWTERCVERTRWKNQPAYKIMLAAPKHAMKGTWEATLIPGQGYGVVNVNSSFEAQGIRFIDESTSELEKVMGIWLPKTSTASRHTDGKLTERYIQQMKYLSLKKPIDPKVFTLGGMDLIPETLVSTVDGIMKWDGAKLGPATNLRKPGK
jgi:hypothetical protein